MDHFQISRFRIRLDGDSQLLIMVSGERAYYRILRDAYYQNSFSRLFDDQYKNYDWGAFAYNIDSATKIATENLLNLFTQVVCIDDALSQTFALSYHSRPFYEGGGRTPLGQLVYEAKPYKRIVNDENLVAATELAQRLITFVNLHPSYRRADYLVSMPAYDKNFDLPAYLVETMCQHLGIECANEFVHKIKSTRQMKDLNTIQEKANEIRGAFEIKYKEIFQNKRVVVVDDVYQSGTTVNELATVLQQAGATVLGLVATKTLRDGDS